MTSSIVRIGIKFEEIRRIDIHKIIDYFKHIMILSALICLDSNVYRGLSKLGSQHKNIACPGIVGVWNIFARPQSCLCLLISRLCELTKIMGVQYSNIRRKKRKQVHVCIKTNHHYPMHATYDMTNNYDAKWERYCVYTV